MNICLFNAAIAAKGEGRKDAARIMGMDVSTLQRKIKGQSDFSCRQIELYCRHYGVSPVDIFFANEYPNPHSVIEKERK